MMAGLDIVRCEGLAWFIIALSSEQLTRRDP
jgi:hypothetical protein